MTFRLLGRRLFSSSSTEVTGKPKLRIFRKLAFGTFCIGYGYYQWEHYSRNSELAKRLGIPFYKVSYCS